MFTHVPLMGSTGGIAPRRVLHASADCPDTLCTHEPYVMYATSPVLGGVVTVLPSVRNNSRPRGMSSSGYEKLHAWIW